MLSRPQPLLNSRLCLAFLAVVILAAVTSATPQFARDTKLPCASCHSFVPRLNSFGQQFYTNGFRIGDRKLKMTMPVWTQAAMESSAGPKQKVVTTYDDSALVSGGQVSGTIYHAMWFPVARDSELYAIRPLTRQISVTAGTIAPLSQFDPELEFAFGGSAVLVPEEFLDSEMDGAPLFQLGDGVLAARAVFGQTSGLPYGEGWNAAVTVPLSNGMDDIRGLTFAQAKGALVEIYRRRGQDSYGAHFFSGKGRTYGSLIAQHQMGKLYVQGGIGHGRFDGENLSAYSLSLDWTPRFSDSFGARVDRVDDLDSVTAFVSHAFGGDGYLLSARLEGQAAKSRLPILRLTATLRF